MKLTGKSKRAHGMTLLELTVVIMVLLALMGILFIAARAWKRGADRGASIMEIRNAQQAVRAYSNMYQHNPGDTVSTLQTDVFGPDKLMAIDPTTTTHPAGSDVTFVIADPTVVPAIGTLYMTCSDSYYAPLTSDVVTW